MHMSLKINRSSLVVLLAMICVNTVYSQMYFPPKTGTWDTLSTNRFGYCSNRIDSLYQFLSATNSKSFILLKDGKIVLEKYFGTFTKDSNWYWASAGKTLTAFCVGIAQQEGKLNIQDKTSKYLGNGWTNLSQSQEDSIKVWNQLTMTTGLDDNLGDRDCTLPSCLVYKDAPGNRWAYHNAPYTLLDKVIEAATSSTLNVFVYQKVANPIGMKGIYFKSGYNNVYGSDSRSMARFGLLLLNQGKWNGTSIMNDTNYFHQMTHSSQKLNLGYGLLTWLNGSKSFMLPQSQLVFPGSIAADAPTDAFMALGKNGQIINVVPSQNLVWIRMGNPPGDNGSIPPLYNNDIWKYINALKCGTLSNSEIEEFAMNVFPNPVKQGNELTFNSFEGHVPQIYNAAGQTIQVKCTLNHGKFTVQTQQLRPGVYFLRTLNQSVKFVIID